MGNERALLFATDPPYAIGYDGRSHPQSWANRGAANRNKDWSGEYIEANNADVNNDLQAGIDLYRGFIKTAIEFAIVRNAAWYLWHASKRHSMVEQVWSEFGAIVHQQTIWVKTRPVFTYSTYLWQHEPCLYGWIKGERPKVRRSQVGATGDEFPTTVGRSQAPKSKPMLIRPRSRADSFRFLSRCTPNRATFATSRSQAAAHSWSRRSRPAVAVMQLKNLHLSSLSLLNGWPLWVSSLNW
jgi:hypothetical protein